MRKLIFGSVLLSAAAVATAVGQPQSTSPVVGGVPELVGAVQRTPTNVESLLTSAIAGNPGLAGELAAGVAKAAPAKASEIGRASVGGLLASVSGDKAEQALANLPSVVRAVVTALVEVLPAGEAANKAVGDYVAAINEALSKAGIPRDAAEQALAAAVQEAVALVPLADVKGALAAPAVAPAPVNPVIPAPPTVPPPPVSASLPK